MANKYLADGLFYFEDGQDKGLVSTTFLVESSVVIPVEGTGSPSQAMRDALTGLGFSGGSADLQLAWLTSLGFTAGSLTDRWISKLDSDVISAGGFSSRKKELYETSLLLTPGAHNRSLSVLVRDFWANL